MNVSFCSNLKIFCAKKIVEVPTKNFSTILKEFLSSNSYHNIYSFFDSFICMSLLGLKFILELFAIFSSSFSSSSSSSFSSSGSPTAFQLKKDTSSNKLIIISRLVNMLIDALSPFGSTWIIF
jgi:hypothetical protein